MRVCIVVYTQQSLYISSTPSEAAVVNTTLRVSRQYLPVYLIAANLDGEFPYIDHCLVALRPTLPLSTHRQRLIRNGRCQQNIHLGP